MHLEVLEGRPSTYLELKHTVPSRPRFPSVSSTTTHSFHSSRDVVGTRTNGLSEQRAAFNGAVGRDITRKQKKRRRRKRTGQNSAEFLQLFGERVVKRASGSFASSLTSAHIRPLGVLPKENSWGPLAPTSVRPSFLSSYSSASRPPAPPQS